MRSSPASQAAIAAFTGLILVGALGGCAATSDDATNTFPGAADAPTRSYKDGTYTESADYQAPSGTETVDVTLTLAGGVVTAVTVAGHATDPEAKIHQGQFASGISGVVVGKKLDELEVDKVGGSSLTSSGFNAAVDEIKADAAA